MKKKILILIFFVSFFIFLAGCTSEDPLNGLEYINDDYGFGLNPPDGWVMNESTKENFIVRFNTSDEVALIIIISEYGTGDTLESHAEWEIEIFEDDSDDFTLISKKSRTINNMDAYEIVYTDKINAIDYTVETKEVLVELNNVVLTLVYYASIDLYDTYLSDFENSISTFTIG